MIIFGAFVIVFGSTLIAGRESCEPFNKNIINNSVSYYCEYSSKDDATNRSNVIQSNKLVCEERSPEDCINWSFSGSKTSTDLAVMRLNTFGQRPDSRDWTVLNVSLTNIKFTNLRYRIQMIDQPDIMFCTEIKLPIHVNISNLHFDCLWNGTKVVDNSYQLEYEAWKESLREARMFLFKINSKRKVEDRLEVWYPFLYIDRTEIPVITARWHQPPANLQRPNYEIKVYDHDTELASETVGGTSGNSSDDELSYKYTCSMFPVYGLYKFTLQVLCKECNMVKSPIIFTDPENLPKVLMLYSPSTQSHIRTVIALAEYLRENCFVVALLDQLDVSRTETKDPFSWYNEAFRHADFIMVISSPPKCCNQGIFKDVDKLALNFLEVLLSRRIRTHIFNVTLDYSGKENIPKETMNFHSYKLTNDMDRMLWYVHNNGQFPKFIDVVCSFLGPKLYGGKSDLKSYRGRTLLGVLKAGENSEINVCTCKCTNSLEKVNSALQRIPEMTHFEEENLHVPNSNNAVNKELNKFFVDLENLNLLGEDDYTAQSASTEPNLLNFLKL